MKVQTQGNEQKAYQGNQSFKFWHFLVIAQLIFFGIIFGFVLGAFYISQQLLIWMIQTSSQQIFLKETNYQLNVNWIQENHILNSMEQTFDNLNKLSKLQEKISDLEHFQTIQPNPCLQNYLYVDQFCFDSVYCYGIFGESTTNQSDIQLTLNLTSVLSQYIYTFGFNYGNIYYTLDNEAGFFAIKKGIVFPKNFNPHKRSWYLSYQNSSTKTRIFGDPYKVLTGLIRIPLISEFLFFQEHIGVQVQELDVENLIQDSENLKMLTYLIDFNGLVIYGKQYLIRNTNLFYLYEENITGFNQSDWNTIQQYIHKLDFSNTCKSDRYLPQGTLCLFNSIENKDLVIQINQIQASPYLLLNYKYDDLVFQEQEQLFTYISLSLKQLQAETFIIFTFVAIAVMILSQIGLKLVMQQTNLVIDYTHSNIQTNYKVDQDKIFDHLKHVFVHSSVIQKLFKALDSLIHIQKHHFSKSEEIAIIESYQYPEQIYGIQNYLFPITKGLRYLKNESNWIGLRELKVNQFIKRVQKIIKLLPEFCFKQNSKYIQ